MKSPLQRLQHRVRSRLGALQDLWRRGGGRAIAAKVEQRWCRSADPLVSLGRSATPGRRWQWQRQGRSLPVPVLIAVVVLDPGSTVPSSPAPPIPPLLRRIWGLDHDLTNHLNHQIYRPQRLEWVDGAIATQPEAGWIATLDRAFAAGSNVVVVLWVGDRLAPHALLRVAQATLDPGFDLLYGDGVGVSRVSHERQWHLHPAFAPLDWQGRPYAVEWWAITREFWQREGRHVPWPKVAETGGDGAIAWGWWIYELGLRAIATQARVRHIPEVLAWIQDRQLPSVVNPESAKLDPSMGSSLDPNLDLHLNPSLDPQPSNPIDNSIDDSIDDSIDNSSPWDPPVSSNLDPPISRELISRELDDPPISSKLDPDPVKTLNPEAERYDRWIQGLITRCQHQGFPPPGTGSPRVEPVPAYPAIRITPLDPPGSPVWVVIPTKNRGDLLRQCIDSLNATSLNATSLNATSLNATAASIPLNFAIVDHESDDLETRAYLEHLRWTWASDRLRIYRHYGPFNFSVINNAAIARLEAELQYEGLPLPEVYLLCNNDVEAIAPGWLPAMLTLLEPPDVGMVGIQLHYGLRELDPDRPAPASSSQPSQPTTWIQHAGVVVGLQGTAEHTGKFEAVRDPGGQMPGPVNVGDRGRLVLDREVSAVTAACVAVRRSVWQAVGGFDSRYGVGFGDVDLCLRVRAAGYRVIQCNRAHLVHHESLSRGKTQRGDPHPQDTDRFHRQWGHLIHDRDAYFQSGDPYFNPHWSISSYGWQPTPLMRWRSRPWVR